MTAALIGILLKKGNLGLCDPAPIPRWHPPGDDRSKIRIADLLRMSSGLKFSGTDDPPEVWGRDVTDHLYVYFGAIDVFQLSINRSPEHPPDMVGRYRNCDLLSLGYIIKRTVTRLGEEYHNWSQKELFDRIGVSRRVLETNPYRNFIMARFRIRCSPELGSSGLLYLQDGVWMRYRILPEGFVVFVNIPALALETPEYGGLFRQNSTGK